MTRGLAALCLATAAFGVLPAAALACADEEAVPGSVTPRSYTRAVRCLINEQRLAAGLATLREDRRLTRAARRFSSSMVREGFFDHVSPQGSTLAQRARRAGFAHAPLGETIGWGTGILATPAAIVEAWMGSPEHHAILLASQFRLIGLGLALGSPAGVFDSAATVTADLGR